MQIAQEQETGAPLLGEDEDEGELDFEDLLKLGDEDAIPRPDT